MNNKVCAALAFVAGVAAGAAVTWKLVKTKYERIAQEEIDSVKEVFGRRAETQKPDEVEEPSVEDCKEVIAECGYSTETTTKKGDEDVDLPYVISPDEYGDFDNYDLVSLVYYSDGVLTDSADDPIRDEDLDDFVGRDFASHFGEYEDDSVFIRNDRLKIDYEILRDLRTYDDVVGNSSSD